MENCEESVIIAHSNMRTGYNVYCGEDLQDYRSMYVLVSGRIEIADGRGITSRHAESDRCSEQDYVEENEKH